MREAFNNNQFLSLTAFHQLSYSECICCPCSTCTQTESAATCSALIQVEVEPVCAAGLSLLGSLRFEQGSCFCVPNSFNTTEDKAFELMIRCVYIQEFYEVTLLNSQKSSEQKLVEVVHMAEQWEHTASPSEGPQPVSPELREERHMELTVEEPAAVSTNAEWATWASIASLCSTRLCLARTCTHICTHRLPVASPDARSVHMRELHCSQPLSDPSAEELSVCERRSLCRGHCAVGYRMKAVIRVMFREEFQEQLLYRRQSGKSPDGAGCGGSCLRQSYVIRENFLLLITDLSCALVHQAGSKHAAKCRGGRAGVGKRRSVHVKRESCFHSNNFACYTLQAVWDLTAGQQPNTFTHISIAIIMSTLKI
ncbi:hypothetical protein E1301_Tti000323 [Triplophysa tibetana]|uniref:Uncharacterized protein n=1 Tax=Triplophysa tibetana TaxID=1572043 RepID=A0A5A9N3W8_9TELE|nr:hypothetical protein E1301_Tti000323 [Triplophysa tibetana]